MPCQYFECTSTDQTILFNGVNYCMTHLALAMKLSPPKQEKVFESTEHVEKNHICESCSA